MIKPTYNKLKPLVVDKENYKYPVADSSESNSDDEIIVNLNMNDYFCISTSMKQKMQKAHRLLIIIVI